VTAGFLLPERYSLSSSIFFPVVTHISPVLVFSACKHELSFFQCHQPHLPCTGFFCVQARAIFFPVPSTKMPDTATPTPVFQSFAVPPEWTMFCPVYVYEEYAPNFKLSPKKAATFGPAHPDHLNHLVGLHCIKASCAQFLVVNDLHKVSHICCTCSIMYNSSFCPMH
jgi:hypothetical protein